MISFSDFNLLMEEDAHVRHAGSNSFDPSSWGGDGPTGKTHYYEVNHPALGSKFHIQVNTYDHEPHRAEVDSVEPEDGGITDAWHRNRGKLGPHVVRKAAKQIADHLGVSSLYGARMTGAHGPRTEHGGYGHQEIRFR